MAAGINHLEIWVSNLSRTVAFYQGIFKLIGWQQLNERSFATSSCDIYFMEQPGLTRADTLGVRHLCFQADSAEMVHQVAAYLRGVGAHVLRGPVEMSYSPGYLTVDFKDPDGLIVEVAYTPNQVFGG